VFGVRVSITRGEETISTGYQYVYSTLKPILPPATTPSEARHIVLDLSKDGNGKYIDPQAEMKLRYVIALSMAYVPSQALRKNTMDFMFIVKKYDEAITYKYEKAICVFDRNKFYKLGEIYSDRSPGKNYKQITLTAFESDLDWDTLTEEWSKNSRYMLVNYEQFFKIYNYRAWW